MNRRLFNKFIGFGAGAGLLAKIPEASGGVLRADGRWPVTTKDDYFAGGDGTRGQTGASILHRVTSGALIKDNFNSGRVDSAVWEQMSSEDPGIKVGFQNGQLRIWGTSAPIPDDKLRKDVSLMCRYAGLYSRAFSATDVSLACRVQMPSGICTEPGDHVAAVHLCGVLPDCYAEVLFGKFEGKITAQIIRNYYPNLLVSYSGTRICVKAVNTTFQDARGWWLAIVGQDLGRPIYRVSNSPIPEQGDERTTFHDVLVEYDQPTRLARGYLKVGKQWTQLGKTEKVMRGLTRVELKLRDFSPLSGTYRDVRFDDCRLYPNPRRNPVRIVLVDSGCAAGDEFLQREESFRVALYTADAERKISEEYTDHGVAELSVVDHAWLAFPVSASVRVYQGDVELSRAQIVAHDVEGLYPGDVWSFDLARHRSSG